MRIQKKQFCVAGATLMLMAFGAVANAQEQFAKKGEFAQFRNLSGLPGGGFAVSRSGELDMKGALSFSTPIAYSLRGGRFAISLGNTSYDKRFRFFEEEKASDFGHKSNGSGVLMGGIGTPYGDVSLSMIVVSGSFENAYNVLFTPANQDGKVTYAVGAQGLFAAGGFIGRGLASNSADRSTSVFAVATAPFGDRGYVSAGIGTSRFADGFANVSYGLTDKIRGMVEYDGCGWNYGVGFEIGKGRIGSRDIKANAFFGMVDGKYAFWSLSVGF